MLFLAKAALGLGGTIVLAGAYTFHEGVIRVDVDESRAGGSHVHMWVPAAAVPMALHIVPKRRFMYASEHGRDFVPLAHAIVKELKKFPDAELIEVDDGTQHVRIRTHEGKLQIDETEPGQDVHLLIPLSTLEDVTSQLEANAPNA
jgi:hypothetical protein